MLDAIAAKLGFVRLKHLRNQLNYGYSVAKRLDEHRELVEAIERKTLLFCQGNWHVIHLATQDDYLMRLFYLVHDCWPEEAQQGYSFRNGTRVCPAVRSRPSILGPCQLPEWISQQATQAKDQAVKSNNLEGNAFDGAYKTQSVVDHFTVVRGGVIGKQKVPIEDVQDFLDACGLAPESARYKAALIGMPIEVDGTIIQFIRDC
jgi:hypothetical protein